MTAPPAGALEACLALLEKATPGEWFSQQATKYTHLRAVGDKHGNPYVMEGGYRHPVRTADDAKAIAAAVNFLRAHGPALLAALRLREWRPIESAPKDGTEVLLCGSKWTASGIGSWDKRALPHRGDWVDDTGALFSPSPTVWMPLPAPPTADDLARVLEEGE